MSDPQAQFCKMLGTYLPVYTLVQLQHIALSKLLLHLGLVSSNRIAWLHHVIAPSQSIVYHLRLLGGNGRRCEP